MRKLKKRLLIAAGTMILAAILLILFISPIVKYLIEKYDEEYTGREITLDRAYVNPFTSYIHLSNVKIYESKSKKVFFSAEGISMNCSIFKLLSKNYDFNDVTLDRPKCLVDQNKKKFNFDDLVEKFSPKRSAADTIKTPTHFSILHIKVNEGIFYYKEPEIPINYFIKKVNIESTGFQWNVDTVSGKFSFLNGTAQGEMKGDFIYDLKKKDYKLALVVKRFDLNIIEQYLKDLSNYGTFRATVDADLKTKGNLNNKININTTGKMVFNDFHFGKNPAEDFASFQKLTLAIKQLSPLGKKYAFDSVIIDKPYFKYERYDHLDNLQTMFGRKGEKIAAANADPTKFNLIIEIAHYVRDISKNFFRSDFNIDRFRVYNANLKFNDFAISEEFSASLDPLTIASDSIDKNRPRAKLSVRSGIKPYGNLDVALSINPKDSEDFDLNYVLQKLPITLFNPYIITYSSFPLDRGTLELKGTWHVRNGVIQSENHLVFIDPRVTKRIRSKDKKWIPLPLIMSFVRERGNVIDYEIPITGNLKDPKFHLKDVILDLLRNIFIKPPTTPYGLEVKSVETEIEKLLTLKWQMCLSTLQSSQEQFLEKMADFLRDNPDASISIVPLHYAKKEKEYILLYEAKKKYFLWANGKTTGTFTDEDSEAVAKMSIKDSSFVHYLNSKTKGSLLFTVQEKCVLVIDSNIVNHKFAVLNEERSKVFMDYFKKKEVETRVKFKPAEAVVPFNGFSFYQIEYKGEFPESLIKAYKKMNELDEEMPRKKFKKERKNNPL